MMLFSILAFFGVALWALVRTLQQEEQKMDLLRTEEKIDTHSPRALRDLRMWIAAHPEDPDVETARAVYDECVEALTSTERHFYAWSEEEIERL